jgi:hypothetical protein
MKGGIQFVPVSGLGGCFLTLYQHYNLKHRFKCPDCDDEFKTQAAVDQVLIFFFIA